MSILSASGGPPAAAAILYEAGRRLVKAAADPELAYNLYGTLYLSKSGWLLLGVPNALAHGVFEAMKEPGIQLPPAGPDGRFNAHISVMSPEDVAAAGGGDAITERGKQFSYTLGRVYSVEPDGWPDVSRVWFVRAHSPELQNLRRSYGLSSLPAGGDNDFHISVAVRRRGVLARSETSKTQS